MKQRVTNRLDLGCLLEGDGDELKRNTGSWDGQKSGEYGAVTILLYGDSFQGYKSKQSKGQRPVAPLLVDDNPQPILIGPSSRQNPQSYPNVPKIPA